MIKKRLLIVEDEANMRGVLCEGLSHNGYTVVAAESAGKGLSAFDRDPFDLVIADMKLPDQDGLQLLETIKSKSPHTPVIIVTGYGSVQNAVEAMRKGAFDYLLKPISIEVLEERILTALIENPSPSKVIPLDGINGSSPILTGNRRMKEIIDLCDRIAFSNAPVLIQGESGTGKELFARHIHMKSPRHQGPFVAVNCASLPESLFESELFGHEKGAFTGALCRKFGKFELANGGTLLLDEISEMSPFLQAKILRVLQENELDRIGGNKPVPVDVRVIATTNRKIETSIETGEFREDLYFRLNVISIQLLPLRERTEDIELLTRFFLKKYSDHYGKPETSISEETLRWLSQQPWRGNVRELKNVVERAVLTGSTPLLDLKDFSKRAGGMAQEAKESTASPFLLREMEKDLIFKALEKTDGNRTHAAKILGISIRTLRNKLHEYKENASGFEVTNPLA
jgi:two-component system response regulator FlrC